MPEVSERAKLAATADDAWRRIGDFGAVGDWHPMLANVQSEGNTPGSVRRVVGSDGSKQVERLESYDAGHHIYRYRIEQTGMPVTEYEAEFRIDDESPGRSIATWRAHFEVSGRDENKAIESVRGFLKAGAEALEQRFS